MSTSSIGGAAAAPSGDGHDLPAGGRRLVQQVDGYDMTIVSGVPIFEKGIETGAAGQALVRASA